MTELDPQIQAVLDAMAAQPVPDEPPTIAEMRAGASAGHMALCPPAVEMAEIATAFSPSTDWIFRFPMPESGRVTRYAPAGSTLSPTLNSNSTFATTCFPALWA